MKIIRYCLGELQANCYLLIKDKECLLIDPADDASFLLEEIARRNLKLVGMLATHGHFDHVMAVGEIQLTYPTVPLYIDLKDKFILDRLEETAEYFLGRQLIITASKLVRSIDCRDVINHVSTFGIEIIYVPGHTPGSVCFYLPDEKILFSGDLIFKDGIGRFDFSYSNKKQLFDSINKIIKTIPEDVIIYPGHGVETGVEMTRRVISKMIYLC